MRVDVEAARAIVTNAKTATLATLSSRAEDNAFPYPFASLVATATDERGRPLLLISSFAEHTKNIGACARASLLFSEPDVAEPLATGRVTLLGDVGRVPDDELTSVRATYLARHPEAGVWASFADFALYRLEITAVRYVAGFGKMGWIDADEYGSH